MNTKLAETLKLWRPGIMAMRGLLPEEEARSRVEKLLSDYTPEECAAIRAMFKEIYQ